MTTPVWPMVPDAQLMPPPAFSLRARREIPTYDATNARAYEHWRTDTPSLTMDRPQPGKTPRHMDMNPEASRTNFKNYLQAQPYVADAGGDTAQNPYFTKYDITQDPRNVIRELRSAVSEDKSDRGLHESKDLLSRSFVNRWIPPNIIEDKSLNTLSAYEKVMRPTVNDMKKSFRD